MLFETFKAFGLIYNTDSRYFKFFTTTFKDEMVDVVMEQFKKDMIAAPKPAAEAKPKPKPKAAAKANANHLFFAVLQCNS